MSSNLTPIRQGPDVELLERGGAVHSIRDQAFDVAVDTQEPTFLRIKAVVRSGV